jgi:Omp85 superfamily domain
VLSRADYAWQDKADNVINDFNNQGAYGRANASVALAEPAQARELAPDLDARPASRALTAGTRRADGRTRVPRRALTCSGACGLVLLAAAALLGAQEPPSPAAPPAPAASEPAPAPGIGRWFNPATAPFIPIPEIDTDPQSGLTLGLIPTWLSTNDREEIERIIAPDIIHSQYFGWGSRMRIFDYPSEDTQWSVVGGLKERVEREFDGRFVADQTRTGPLSWSVETIYDRSGTPRFFGIGNETPFANQTNYLDSQSLLDVVVARNFTRSLQLSYRMRVRYVDVLPGVLRGLPSIGTLFPGLKGIGNEHELQHTLMLTRDTRDSVVIPHSGARYIVYSGFVSGAWGSSVSYTYYGAEARCYWPLASNVTLAWHAAARYMPSAGNAPFWALSSLGGESSVTDEREPLRDDGPDRYMDRNLFASGAELRTRIGDLKAFGTDVGLELAPFVDAGKVFATAGTSPLSQLHNAVGVGVRGVASPYIVGYVDFGYGNGHAAVFSGINYPF